MRRGKRTRLKALALLLAAAILLLAVRQHSTTTLPPRALVTSDRIHSDALRVVRAAGDERREELYQALRARGAADAAASAAQAREQASNARAAAAERRAVQAEAALKAREQASNARAAAAERRAVQAEAALKAREQASNATQFLKCAHRAKAYGAAWLARTELLARQRMSEDKNALEYASFHILTESIRLGATALKAVDDSFWVNHISGYEHNVKRREGAEAAENSVNAMVRVLTNKLCIPRTRSPTSTLALIPFYSGLARDGARKDGIAFEDLPNTGNAHSMSSGATKLKTLKAVLCSALSFCKAALVGVCTSRDYESVTELLGPLPAGQARAVLLNCEQTPAYLPYKLLRLVQRHAKGTLNATHVAPAARPIVQWISELDFDFVLYDEADNTFHFEGTALRDIFEVLTQHPDYYVAPQRYEKGWGGSPRSILQGNLSKVGQNTCEAELPRLVYNRDCRNKYC
jgi:hypothetical protein